jgi:hypothetical protein
MVSPPHVWNYDTRRFGNYRIIPEVAAARVVRRFWGARSITRLDMDEAKPAGKPVFALTVDPDARWTEAEERDRQPPLSHALQPAWQFRGCEPNFRN